MASSSSSAADVMTSCKTCSLFRHKLKESEAKTTRLLLENRSQDKLYKDMITANVELHQAATERMRTLPTKKRNALIEEIKNKTTPASKPWSMTEARAEMKRAFDAFNENDEAKTPCEMCGVLRHKLMKAEGKIAYLVQANRSQDNIIDDLMKSNGKLWEASNEAPRVQRDAERTGNITTSESEDEEDTPIEANINSPPADAPSSPDEARDELNRVLDEMDADEYGGNDFLQNANAGEP